MAKCITNKKMYATKEMAEENLIEMHSKFHYAPGNGPINVYQCDDCGYFHFTSKGNMNEKLAKAIADGNISKQREANHWLNKLKKR